MSTEEMIDRVTQLLSDKMREAQFEGDILSPRPDLVHVMERVARFHTYAHWLTELQMFLGAEPDTKAAIRHRLRRIDKELQQGAPRWYGSPFRVAVEYARHEVLAELREQLDAWLQEMETNTD